MGVNLAQEIARLLGCVGISKRAGHREPMEESRELYGVVPAEKEKEHGLRKSSSNLPPLSPLPPGVLVPLLHSRVIHKGALSVRSDVPHRI